MEASLAQLLRAGAGAVGVSLDDPMIDAFDCYLNLLLFWNKRVNLTAIRSPEGIIARHFIDSLAAVPHVPTAARSLADLGSGAGFPGAVIALARPALSVTLVESIHKKAAFLEALRRELPLPNVAVSPLRAEDWAKRTSPPDVVISRATWDILDWLAKARDWVRPGGRILAMEGGARHPLPPDAARHPYGDGGHALITVDT